MYISQYAFYPFATSVCCGSLKAIDWFTLQIYIYFLINKQFYIIFFKKLSYRMHYPRFSINLSHPNTSRAYLLYIICNKIS